MQIGPEAARDGRIRKKGKCKAAAFGVCHTMRGAQQRASREK